jgi:3'-phosphoadenosine 5'-phosphosulfate sulfotransferase (PAPS reductase)/FAD synthetase
MYTESGDYSQFFTASNGCDSVVMLHLTVSHPTTGDTTAVACDAFTWYELINIIQSGNYTRTFTSAAGCDSVVTLHLTVNSSEESEFAIATEDSCYIWNAETYCSSGDYVQTLQTVNGCDSVVTLHLTVSVGIDNYDDFDFKVYPNPTNGIVFVQCAMNDVQVGTIEVRLYDAYGKMLDVEEIQGVTTLRTTEIDMSRFASGIYFVRAVADGNVVAVRKMVKR